MSNLLTSQLNSEPYSFSILNILTQLGFSVTCVILGGQTLASVGNVLPLEVGIVIVSVVTLIICFFGYAYLRSSLYLVKYD